MYDVVVILVLNTPYTQGNNCGQDIEEVSISTTTVHPDYSKFNDDDNDFALIKLEGNGASATPVNIDDGTYSPTYANGKGNLWPIGFGNATLDGSAPGGEYYFPERLQHVEVKYITNAKCVSDYGYEADNITGNMMCARDDGNQDSCQGDSGGPLYDSDNNVLVGVVSWGTGCGLDEYPGVYARISAQFDWIKGVVCNDHSASTIPAWCGTTEGGCNDSPLRMLVNKKVKRCNWVRKNTFKRCKKNGVSSHCPATCNKCATYQSSDSSKWWLQDNNNGKARKCGWVARKPKRCSLKGVSDTCRAACA